MALALAVSAFSASSVSVRTLKSCALVALFGLTAACGGGRSDDAAAPADTNSAAGSGRGTGSGATGTAGGASAPIAGFTAATLQYFPGWVQFDAASESSWSGDATFDWTIGVNFMPISQAIGESYLLNDRWHVATRALCSK